MKRLRRKDKPHSPWPRHVKSWLEAGCSTCMYYAHPFRICTSPRSRRLSYSARYQHLRMGFAFLTDHTNTSYCELNQAAFPYCTSYNSTAFKHRGQVRHMCQLHRVRALEVRFKRALSSCSAFRGEFHLPKYKTDFRKSTVLLTASQLFSCGRRGNLSLIPIYYTTC